MAERTSAMATSRQRQKRRSGARCSIGVRASPLAFRLRYQSVECIESKETKMNRNNKLAAVAALAAILAVPSLFAEQRHSGRSDEWRGRQYESQRVTVEGRVRDIDRSRNDFVIRLDRNDYVLRVDRNTNGLRGLERGDYVRVVGTLNRGTLYVDRINELRDEDRRGGRDDSYIVGVVQNVDRRGNVVWIELERSNRVVAVDVRRVDRNRHQYDVDDLRRGDRITVRGDWQRNGRFEAERLDVDRGARR
jgi:hypothetical protein